MEEIHNFNTDNEDAEIVKDLLIWALSLIQRETAGKKSRLKLRRAAMEDLGKIKCKDVSLETKALITHILIFPIIVYGCESWTVKKADRKKEKVHLKYAVGGELCRYHGLLTNERVGPGGN